MNFDKKSTAGPRQFEQTAIAKLVAVGVPKHIADVFVKIGLPKSGRMQEVKDHVCKMEYKPFFIQRTLKDYQDPLRVGAYVPYVFETKPSRFHCEFQMTEVECAKFAMQFPEYDVKTFGKITNQHAFYANKRYAECELLVDMIHMDAKRTGLDPSSVVDLGGNSAWHFKRGRETVHCDNPVLSVRDIMRYKVREIQSGINVDDACRKTFQQCTHKADYAMAVHATYDITPKQLAQAMSVRDISKFFGVINFIPGIQDKPAGQYEEDGVTMNLVRDHRIPAYVECGFRHDPSLKYKHDLRVLARYLYISKRYDVVTTDGTIQPFLYKVESVRGNSIIFSLSRVDGTGVLNQSVWSVPATRSYFISLRSLGVRSLEVDAELFDRLVLQAASARNIVDYDIVSLFRYGKSLRQRVTLNGVVLSSGYMYKTEDLVYAVIAAYGTAAAFRVESGNYFSKASSQMINARSKGFITDTFTIIGKGFLQALLLLPKALGYITGLAALDRKISELIRHGRAISVVVSKPHASVGMTYDASFLTKKIVLQRVKQSIQRNVKPSLRALFYAGRSAPIDVEVEGSVRTFMAKGMVPYDPHEIPGATSQIGGYQLEKYAGTDTDSVEWVENARQYYYDQALKKTRDGKFDSEFSVMANGDRIVRHGTTDSLGRRVFGRQDMDFVGNRQHYAVLRGVGSNVVRLKPPKMYSDNNCIGFYLFFEGILRTKRVGAVEFQSYDDEGATAPPRTDKGQDDNPSNSGWSDLASESTNVDVRVFSSAQSGDQFMATRAAEDGYFMSGALPNDGPVTPPIDASDAFVSDYVAKLDSAPLVEDSSQAESGEDPIEEARQARRPADDSDNVNDSDQDAMRTVHSDEVVPGRRAMEELLYVIDESTAVATASAAALINFATSVAAGDASMSRFAATAQGHPGNMLAVRVDQTGEFLNLADGKPVEHMAVSDGVSVYDRITNPPLPGVYVTGDVLMIYTGAAIKQSVVTVLADTTMADVVCVDGVAGSGKSYHIENNAKAGDVVLCETRASLQDLAEGLAKIEGWGGTAYTIDSFLLHRQVATAETLWVDESFRLHAGKIYAIVKLLKPARVVCFGDSKQIPALPFIPKYDFIYHEFPYTSIQLKTDSWRCPADVVFALSVSAYYGRHVTTHNPILRSLSGPVRFVDGMFHNKPPDHALLVYEKDLAHDLKKSGVKNVFSVGESQGKTFDHVMLYRSNSNGKQIYYDKFQALVAMTRHRRSFMYVTVCSVDVDDSAVARSITYVRSNGNEKLFSSHLCTGVRGVADYNAYLARDDPSGPSDGHDISDAVSDWDGYSDLGLEVTSRTGDWADMVEEEFSLFE